MQMSGEVVISVNVIVAPGREQEFLHVMNQDASESRLEPGCMCFHVSKLPGERAYMFYEVYQDDEAVQFHKETPHYQAWNKFRESGGIQSLNAQVCDGVFIAPDAYAAYAKQEYAQSPAHHGHEETMFDRHHDDESPQRHQMEAPRGFSHPRGLAEKPTRPGCISNYGKNGVRHSKKASPKVAAGQTTLRFYEGGLAGEHGDVIYGSKDVQGLPPNQGKGRVSAHEVTTAYEGGSFNMNPNAPSSSPGATAAGRALHQDWKMQSKPDLLCPKPLPPAKHLLPPNQPWAAQNHESVFDGGMEPSKQDEPRRMRHLPEKEWANQAYKSNLRGGEAIEAEVQKTPDPAVAWANAEKKSHMGIVDGHLSAADGPISYGHPSTMGATAGAGKKVNSDMRSMMQKSYYKGAGMAPPPPQMEKREMDPRPWANQHYSKNSFGNGMAPPDEPAKPTPPKAAQQPWADDREQEIRAGVPRRMGGMRGYSK